MAVTYSAQLDMELGRSRRALRRLLERAGQHPSDPHLLAGLVQACRYCGLAEASIGAHELARRLDPQMPTGVVNSFWLKGDYARALEEARHNRDVMFAITLASVGRDEEAIDAIADDEVRFGGTAEAEFARIIRLVLQGRPADARPRLLSMLASPTFVDPEALLHSARLLARMGELDIAMTTLARAVERGFCGLPGLMIDAWLDPLRGRSDFHIVLGRAAAEQRAAIDSFTAARGERLLGVGAG